MKRYRKHFNNSFQRAISPDARSFYRRFYEILISADPRIKDLFAKTDMDRQITMLMQSMTHIMTFSATLEPSDEIEKIAVAHGKNQLNITAEVYDIWFDSMIKTVEEIDPKFEGHIETSWRVLMAPGIEYMKSFCKK